MKTSDSAIDRELQDLADSLHEIKAPPGLESQLAQLMAAHQNARRPWYAAAATVLVSAAAALLLWRSEPVQPVIDQQQMTAGYVVLKQQIPVRTFSLHSGPSVRMVQASVVKDHSGLTRAIYVHRAPTTQPTKSNWRPL